MCAKIARQRADQLVFMQGLAESREQARRLIMAGKVALSSAGLPPGAPPQKVDKPGHPYPEGTVFDLLGQERFVSRGAYKLLTILDNFRLDVGGMVCLDAGASTGGFTDCLLQHGAARVYAVDVGKNCVPTGASSTSKASTCAPPLPSSSPSPWTWWWPTCPSSP